MHRRIQKRIFITRSQEDLFRNKRTFFGEKGVHSNPPNPPTYGPEQPLVMCGNIEMKSRCVEDELSLKSFFHPMGTSIIHNKKVSLLTSKNYCN